VPSARLDRQLIKYRLQSFGWYRPIHLAYTSWRARHGGLPNWQGLVAAEPELWRQALAECAGSRKRVLIATGAGGHLPSMTMESLLAVALTLRGVATEVLLCDAALPACMMSEVNWYHDIEAFASTGPRDRCSHCLPPAAKMLDDAGLGRIDLSQGATDVEKEEAARIAFDTPVQELVSYTVDGVGVGEHALAGTLRFFARGELDGSAAAERVFRRYFQAALLTWYSSSRLFVSRAYEAVVLNHGIYVPQGVIAAAARRHGVRLITWHPAYRRQCFTFSHADTYHHTLRTEPVSEWEGIAWTDAQREQIELYLKSRWTGEGDWIKFHDKPEFALAEIEKEIGIDLSRPTIGLLTNVAWDAQLHYPKNAFANMFDWLFATIEYFRTRPELQLLIRVHPAELTGTLPSRQPAIAEIRRRFARLPENVFIIPPESRLSTYVAMTMCNAVSIYGTKAGVELSAAGIPVIVAGEAWIRGKGVTLDAESREHYFDLLARLPLSERLTPEVRDRALKYAYHFFFRRMIPVQCVEQSSGWPPFRLAARRLSQLRRGRVEGLDLICEGIEHGRPFVYLAEQIINP